MGQGNKVELFAAIRWDHHQGLGVRALARKYEVHRRTVRVALDSPVPPERKEPARAAPVRESVAGWIDEMLREDLEAPRKQRHTSRRIFERLRDEHDAAVSYSYVCKYAGPRRAQIEAEHRDRAGGAGGAAGFVPQAKEPGAEAEVDFGDVEVRLAGQLVTCRLFAYRLSYSGRGVHRVYATQAQEAFLEGHVTAFEVTGGVPWRHIRYDNLSPAVAKVLAGRSRAETSRWLSFRSWYGFEAFYCEPGLEGAHEKGGVEGEIGRFRRRWLVPVPEVSSLGELNARLAEADAAEDGRHIGYRAAAVGEDFAAEAPRLLQLPGEAFDTAVVLWPRADKFARISVGKCRYSVPARLIGSRVRVALTANELRVFDGSRLAAVHPRLAAPGAEHLDLDHYLEILVRKPGALPGSAPLAQARQAGTFTASHDAFWAAARARLGDGAGTRALIEVLLLHRRMPAGQVTAGITAALAAGTCSPDVVAVEARKHAGAGTADAGADGGAAWPALERARRQGGAVITLPRREGALPADRRAAPSVAAYDQLLPRPGAAGREGAG
jgi:transposase